MREVPEGSLKLRVVERMITNSETKECELEIMERFAQRAIITDNANKQSLGMIQAQLKNEKKLLEFLKEVRKELCDTSS